MTLVSSPERASLMMVEGGLTMIAVALAFWWPGIGASWFRRIELVLGRLARNRHLSVLTVGVSAIALRLLILPFCPIPHPFVQDDFSFLLAADTFASGRLTNPTPAMWRHFESFHITMNPTYMSMYFPANGLVLAMGKVLFGHPWFGLLIVMGLMCAALCWMLQAWLPPTWALLGGLLAVLRIGLFSYWINTYTGAGCVSALGGALVLGAFPRFRKSPRLRYALVLTAGILLLVNSRGYEGALLCVPVFAALAWWMFFSKDKPQVQLLLRSTALPVALLIAAAAWMGYYNYKAFGSPLTPPYKVNRAAYGIAPYYVWQGPRPEPSYRHRVMWDYYAHNEMKAYTKLHNVAWFVPVTAVKAAEGVLFFAGIALMPPLIMIRRVFLDRRIRFLVVCLLVLMAGLLIEIFFIPHYVAPFTAVFYALGLQCMRHLRAWKPGDRPAGAAIVRLVVALCVALGVVRLYAEPLHLEPVQWPPSAWDMEWYGPGRFGAARSQIEDRLESAPGKQLVIVRYSAKHDPLEEWVYNAADIDHSKVIWAREMSDAENRELIRYYKDRKVWLIEPDAQPAKISLYPVQGTDVTAPQIHSASNAGDPKTEQGGKNL